MDFRARSFVRQAIDGAQKLRKLLGIVEGVVDALVLSRKGRQCRRPGAFLCEDWDEG
jgi:hypothetical protein